MYTWILILLLSATAPSRAQPGHEPNVTTCEDFERGAKFNPYEMVDSMWKIFYFWGNHTELYPIIFNLPARKRLLKLKELMDSIEPHIEIEWDKATLIMLPRPGIEVVFLYLGTPGAFRALVLREQREKVRPFQKPFIRTINIRLKQLSGRRYIAIMNCDDRTVYSLGRMYDLPETDEECQEVAKLVNYRGVKGRCFLELFKYQEKDEL